MPYLPSSARNKSNYYQKILDADIIEQQNKHFELLQKQQVSGSIDANVQIRNEKGSLVSIESPFQKGKAIEQDYELIRVENRQEFFDPKNQLKIKDEFEFFRPPPEIDMPDDELDRKEIEVELVKEERQQKADIPLRNMVVRFVNRALRENNPIDVKGSLLNAKLARIFKQHLKPMTMIGISKDLFQKIKQKRGLPRPPAYLVGNSAAGIGRFMGNVLALKRLKRLVQNSMYSEIYQDFILPTPDLREFWAQANENAPRNEFDTYAESGLESEEEFK